MAVELSKFDFNELEGYKEGVCFQLRYGWVKPIIWIESGFDIDDGLSIDGYGFTLSPNEALTNFDEELEKAMRRITNWNKKVRTNLCDVGDDVCFSLEIEGDEPIVKDTNNRIIFFEKLVNSKSYGRCKLSIEEFCITDDYIEPIIKLEEIVLK